MISSSSSTLQKKMIKQQQLVPIREGQRKHTATAITKWNRHLSVGHTVLIPLLKFLEGILLPLFNRSGQYYDKKIVKLNHVTLVEPVMATAMMATFSVIYRRIKDNIVTRLKNIEQDLIIENRITAITNACIKQNGPIPLDALNAVMNDIKTLIKIECEPVDDYVKRLNVIWYHPRTGNKHVNQVLLPINNDLKLSDPIEINSNAFSTNKLES
jgi:hypothetical protein